MSFRVRVRGGQVLAGVDIDLVPDVADPGGTVAAPSFSQ
jgi:hypothetical protein